jgi:hypothetical protein
VQKVREAAARMSCQNNLKQIGIACQSFHDTYSRLPPGAANDAPPFGNSGVGWGSSWKLYILPFIEQANIYNAWSFTGNSGYQNSANGGLIANLTIKPYRCPSSPVPNFMTNRGNNISIMNTSYTGIAGSVISAYIPGSQIYNATCCNGSGPLATDNGLLYSGSQVAITAITDGTSNTWIVGEQSDHLRDANRQPITAGYDSGVGNSQGRYGWAMGAAIGQNQLPSAWGDGRHFNCTSVLYSINQIGLTNSASSGTNNDVGTNFPLNSNHTNGVNNLCADGSVHFYSNSTSLQVISALCTKSDGEVVNTP